MSTKYYLQKVPVEAVQPGFSLAIPHDGDYRLFQVDCTQMCQRSGQPVMIRLMSESVDGGQPWVLEYEAGTAVIRLLGVCQAASSGGVCSLTGLGGGYKRQRALCLLLDVH